MEFCFVYVTCVSIGEAQKIAEALIAEQLAACSNVVPAMLSTYMWRGNLTHAEEVMLLLKTRLDRFEAVQQRVKALHSYTTPAIFALPVVAMDEDYSAWLREGVK